MTKRLVRTAILIGFVVIVIVLNICVNSTRQEDENTLDIEKIYILENLILKKYIQLMLNLKNYQKESIAF